MRHRPRWGLLLIGAIFVALLFAYPLWRQVFQESVQTAIFPLVNPAQRAVLVSMPNRDFAATAYAALLTPVLVPTEQYPAPVAPDAQIVLSGEFASLDAVHVAQGRAVLYRLRDDSVLLRLQDFAVTNGPSLTVYLSGSEAPRTIGELGGVVPEFIVGALLGNQGDQQFDIPRELNLERYNSVVILSEGLQEIYSFATLE